MSQLELEKSRVPPTTYTTRAIGGLASHSSMQNTENAVTYASCFMDERMGFDNSTVKPMSGSMGVTCLTY